MFAGPTHGSDQRFSNLTGKNIGRESKIVIRINLPSTNGLFKWVIAGLVIVLAGTGGFLSFFKGRKSRLKKKADPEQGLMEQKQALLSSIAKLDEAHHSGQIASDQYEKKRQELKDKAVEITKMLKG